MPASAVTYNVLQGVRPDRPRSGFSNQLWRLLETTWLPEHASRPPKRPQISIIIDQLRRDADNWNKSMIPPNPRQIGAPDMPTKGSDTYLLLHAAEGVGSVETDRSGSRTLSSTERTSGNVVLPRDFHHPSQTNSNRAVQRNTRKSKFAQRIRRFFSLDFIKRRRGF